MCWADSLNKKVYDLWNLFRKAGHPPVVKVALCSFFPVHCSHCLGCNDVWRNKTYLFYANESCVYFIHLCSKCICCFPTDKVELYLKVKTMEYNHFKIRKVFLYNFYNCNYGQSFKAGTRASIYFLTWRVYDSWLMLLCTCHFPGYSVLDLAISICNPLHKLSFANANVFNGKFDFWSL